MPSSISTIAIGVENLNSALDLWVDTFDLELVKKITGLDENLATLWGIDPDNIRTQALVRTPGVEIGQLHLVEFKTPNDPVRKDANSTDLGPKNLDLSCKDLPKKYDELQQMGYSFRSKYIEYRIETLQADVIEVQMPGHDETNIVFMEWLEEKIKLSAKGYGGITSLVVIVPDTAREGKFYSDLFNLKETLHEELFGEHIEKMIGLPQGGGLNLRLLSGDEKDRYGTVEIISYVGASNQVNRFKLASPPALGVLHCSFLTNSMKAFTQKAKTIGVDLAHFGDLNLIYGNGPVCSLRSPAGLRIDVQERTSK